MLAVATLEGTVLSMDDLMTTVRGGNTEPPSWLSEVLHGETRTKRMLPSPDTLT